MHPRPGSGAGYSTRRSAAPASAGRRPSASSRVAAAHHAHSKAHPARDLHGPPDHIVVNPSRAKGARILSTRAASISKEAAILSDTLKNLEQLSGSEGRLRNPSSERLLQLPPPPHMVLDRTIESQPSVVFTVEEKSLAGIRDSPNADTPQSPSLAIKHPGQAEPSAQTRFVNPSSVFQTSDFGDRLETPGKSVGVSHVGGLPPKSTIPTQHKPNTTTTRNGSNHNVPVPGFFLGGVGVAQPPSPMPSPPRPYNQTPPKVEPHRGSQIKPAHQIRPSEIRAEVQQAQMKLRRSYSALSESSQPIAQSSKFPQPDFTPKISSHHQPHQQHGHNSDRVDTDQQRYKSDRAQPASMDPQGTQNSTVNQEQHQQFYRNKSDHAYRDFSDPPNNQNPMNFAAASSVISNANAEALARLNGALKIELDSFRRKAEVLEEEKRVLVSQQLQQRQAAKTTAVSISNDENAFLKHRLQFLENENRQLRETVANLERKTKLQLDLGQKCEELKGALQEERMQVSRLKMENKSILDQNSILRRENKRLMDEDSTLRNKLIEVERDLFETREKSLQEHAERIRAKEDDGRLHRRRKSEGDLEREGSCVASDDSGAQEDSKHRRAKSSKSGREHRSAHSDPDISFIDPVIGNAQRVARESLIERIDSEVQLLKGVQSAFRSLGISSTLAASGTQFYEELSRSFEALRLTVLSISTEPGPPGTSKSLANVLRTCSDALNIILSSKTLIMKIVQDSTSVDERIHRLSDESARIRQEAEKTITELNSNYAQELEALQRENGEMDGQLDSIQKELEGIRRIATAKEQEVRRLSEIIEKQQQKLQQQHSSGGSRNGRRSARDEGQESNTVTTSSGSSPYLRGSNGLAVDALWSRSGAATANGPNPDSLAYIKRIEELKIANLRLKRSEETLLKTIEDWKRENETLNEMLRKREARGPFANRDSIVESLEGEVANLGSKLDQMDSALEDERLKVRKAEELKRKLELELETSRKETAAWKARAASVRAAEQKLSSKDKLPSDMEDRTTTPDSSMATMKQLEKVLRERLADLIDRDSGRSRRPNLEVEGLLNVLGPKIPGKGGLVGDLSQLEALLSLFQENKNNAAQLASLTEMVESHVKQMDQYRKENESLNQKLKQSYEKIRSRETTWLAKFKEVRDEHERIQREYQEILVVLIDYEKQYQSSTLLVSTSGLSAPDDAGSTSVRSVDMTGTTTLHSTTPGRHGIKDSSKGSIPTGTVGDHPLPFLPLMAQLHNSLSSATTNLKHVSKRNTELTKASEEQGRQLQILADRAAEKGDRLVEIERRCEEKERTCAVLETRMKEVEKAKREAETKMKKIAIHYKMLMDESSSRSLE
ncbi:hypothetical protein BJ742DRAFT_855185 [Cladochytrium replicatum]|nr:hypothetical protein BJ742DRAFT_855185 [Cladochytrium replicatum]